MFRRDFLVAALASIAATACAVENEEDEASATEGALAKPWTAPLVMGHRGAPLAEAENTLPSFDAALAQGANALEIDVCITGDGHFVLWNDRNPDDLAAKARQNGLEGLKYVPYVPTADEYADEYIFRRPVDRLTLAEFREHYGYGKKGWFSTTRDPNAKIPTVPELAEWARGKAALKAITFDVKLAQNQGALGRDLCDVIARVFAGTRIDISLTTPYSHVAVAMQKHIRERGYKMTMMMTCESGSSDDALGQASSVGLDGVVMGDTPTVRWSTFIAAVRGVCARRGSARPKLTRVLATTADDEAEMKALLDAGVDGIVTNKPDVLARIVRARGNG